MKDHKIATDNTAYKYYLEDLLKDFDALGYPKQVPQGQSLMRLTNNNPVTLTPPPIPEIFSTISDDTTANIRWAVQIYHDFLNPLGNEELAKRAHELYTMAQEATKNRGQDEKSGESVEKHLSTTMLANRRESLQENAYINFFLLMLMQIGILHRILSNNETIDTAHLCNEIDRTYERGAMEASKQRASLRMYKRRQQEIVEEFKILGSKGGKAKNEKRYASPKDYAEQRFIELRKLSSPYNRSGQMANTIAKELAQKCGADIEGIPVDSETIRKKWIPEFKQKCPPAP